jgi:radical SAM-linked protein
MRTVFKFSKSGAARYISHLDLMRTMSRAIRRAVLPAAWSQGFHPHIVMSFAQALGLGYLSYGEYMDITLDDTCTPAQAVIELNKVLPDGIHMSGAWQLAEAAPTLMASVSAARWLVEFDEIPGELLDKFVALLAQDTIEVIKEGKNGTSNVEIRRGIYSIEGRESGIELFLAAGSVLNIRPELVIKAALGSDAHVKVITRLELYTLVNGQQMPFYKICIGGDLYECGKDDIS